MFDKFLLCAIVIFYVNRGALGYPISNLYKNFNVSKYETPIQVRFEDKTSLGSPIIVDSLTSGTYNNGFNIAPGDTDKPNIDNVTATTYSFKNETIVTDANSSVPNFNDVDNSITDANTETDSPSEYTIEFTTDYTTTENYDNATFLYDEEDVLRSEVSPEVLASLLG